ncbi:carboxylesterase family protein [Nocardia sp. AG03]|uniref:carboxylesterase family protein n=1 Tax=Nocardia sp. AG03 TaxID=3025312 RepID=UPI00241893BF|nr:carboxylesterase family protein [Nocardia sp. AG03]
MADGDFLPEPPLTAIAAGRAHPVPLIIGTNLDEATLFQRFGKAVPHTRAQLSTVFARCAPGTEQRVLRAYPGYPAPRTAVRMGGDFMFLRPTLAVLEAHSRYAPTFAYRFDYAPRALRAAGFGATHALDLVPVFGWVDGPVGRMMTAAGGRRGFRAVQDFMQDNWAHFARTGSPLPAWSAYTAERRATCVIDHPPRVLIDPEPAKRQAWHEVSIAVAEDRNEA